MRSYFPLFVLLIILLSVVLYLFFFGFSVLPAASIAVIGIATVLSAIIIANEFRRPIYHEYNRKKALFPKIPEKYLTTVPPSGSVVFGKDYHTNKTVAAEPGHHTLICGSTGSGKTASCLIPSILSCNTGSKQIVDIKSRELVYKTANIYDENTRIIDFNIKKPWVWGWDIFYKLPKDGSATEQQVLKVVREVASVVVPKSTSGDAFWADAARNEFIGLMLFEFCYGGLTEFIDIVNSMMNTPLREHMERALNTVPKTSLVASYLTGLAATADETLFSVDLTLSQNIYPFVSEEAVYFFRDNRHRANPAMLNKEGVTQYICVSEEALDSGFDKMMNIVMKQTLQELQSRTSSGTYPQTMLYWDEWQRLTESCEELRQVTSSFLKTGRSKQASVVLCCQNLDNFKKEVIYDILSNIHYFYILSSNNSNSLTTEVVCKMSGIYVEKTVSTSEGRGTSKSVSFQEKQVLRPEDLNNLGEDAVLIITNHGYVRTRKTGTFYFSEEPYKSQYGKIFAVNEKAMDGV